MAPHPSEQVHVFRLENADAEMLAKSLRELFGQGRSALRIAAETHTNSLLAYGPAEQISHLRTLISALNQLAKEQPRPDSRRKAEPDRKPSEQPK
jgi:type II secretory pathway component GspD/PulD (secretin)